MESTHMQRLHELLLENKKWPLRYMFKFIVPNADNKVDQVTRLMPHHGKISFNHTKNLRHVAVTCVADMTSAEQIIETTKLVVQVEGVISL